ncbi:hypothetical protein VOLCADRAFT_106301 [Volvox carteri f. nagariensis]|uniref:Uncharacterized protein n=1 Tax=Volvox carteri f. nagariensis TaxID=3068 RepID=D8U6F8_VOLCA|nr:uncharacterized protein VOLCADRAFT_106301 [Volvox carteri f. nagariensis]EFJ44639.1 hypothetical protein VOLCADRAFT_106301 [Volvox carteri f. nagariensis]|eukprot:XP_002954215.1 hypothetical protein VOLCADRAFT_106301 [Volvox carteri f. nagariensis]
MVAKFRLCCWPLEVNKGHHRPRECRTCQVCTSGKVEDEYHVLMECEAYTELRNRFLINVEDTDMRKVFLNTNPRKIATFLTEVFDERQQRALEPHGSRLACKPDAVLGLLNIQRSPVPLPHFEVGCGCPAGCMPMQRKPKRTVRYKCTLTHCATMPFTLIRAQYAAKPSCQAVALLCIHHTTLYAATATRHHSIVPDPRRRF